MPHKTKRPSLLGGLLWIGLGVLFLLRNLSIGPDLWSMIARYWPILLILLGLAKVIEYFWKKQGVSIRIGEVLGILLILLVGTAITKISSSAAGMNRPSILRRASTMSRTYLRIGPWSRGSR